MENGSLMSAWTGGGGSLGFKPPDNPVNMCFSSSACNFFFILSAKLRSVPSPSSVSTSPHAAAPGGELITPDFSTEPWMDRCTPIRRMSSVDLRCVGSSPASTPLSKMTPTAPWSHNPWEGSARTRSLLDYYYVGNR